MNKILGDKLMKTVKIIVEGTVTGVGFRYSAQREARRYPEITGAIHNASPRRVEAVIQGPDADVDELCNWFRHGPPSASVTSCVINPAPNSDAPSQGGLQIRDI